MEGDAEGEREGRRERGHRRKMEMEGWGKDELEKGTGRKMRE